MDRASESKKVLFISHDASRTGAPMVLLEFLQWIKRNTELAFEILIQRGARAEGDLLAKFESLAPVTVLDDLAPYSKNLPKRMLRKVGFNRGTKQAYFDYLKKERAGGRLDLIYSNTVANGATIEWLSKLDVPVITHVHELDHTIKHYVGADSFRSITRHTAHFIAVSEAVKSSLVQKHGIPDNRIDVVYEFIQTQGHATKNHDQAKRDLLRQLGAPDHALVVGGSGSVQWRKGSDLFVQMARLVQKRSMASVYFVWIGGPIDGLFFDEVSYDLQRLGIESQVRFVGPVSNPLDYVAAMDVFALTSREDPFPLVCLEAASLGKPIVCFDRAGGAREFVEDDCGYVVPYLDIYGMADRVSTLLQNPDLRCRFGRRAQQKVAQQHDINVSAPKIYEIIQRFLSPLSYDVDRRQ